MSWSPNFLWIAHRAAFTLGLGATISNYIISRDGSTLLDLPTGGPFQGGWVTSDWYFVYEAGHGSSHNSLNAVHLPDDRYLRAWDRPFSSYAFDVADETLAVSLYDPALAGTGTYLSTVRGKVLEEIAAPMLGLVTWGRGPQVSWLGRYGSVLDHARRRREWDLRRAAPDFRVTEQGISRSLRPSRGRHNGSVQRWIGSTPRP
jgi:hypothetical protein